MRACARRAYCMTENFRRFQRIFKVFLWPGAWQKLPKFLQADPPDSADWSINPAKTPRYGKSTMVYRKNFIHRMLMIRVSVRPLRMRENFLFYEYSILSFMVSRSILHFLGENTTHAIWQSIYYYFKTYFSECVKTNLYRFKTNTARRPANQQGKKLISFRSQPRAIPPIYNNGYTTQYMYVNVSEQTTASE